MKAGQDLEDDFDKGNVFISVAAMLPGMGEAKHRCHKFPFSACVESGLLLCVPGGQVGEREGWWGMCSVAHISCFHFPEASGVTVCQALSLGQRSRKRDRVLRAQLGDTGDCS